MRSDSHIKIRKNILSLFAIVFISIGCSENNNKTWSSSVPIGERNPENVGSLAIDISEIRSRLIITDYDLVPNYISITGIGPGNASFNKFIELKNYIYDSSSNIEISVEINKILVGEWKVIAEALNSSMASIAGGGADVTILIGKTTDCNILIEPYFGIGTLDLTITWDDEIKEPLLEVILERKGYDPHELDHDINPELGTASVYTDLDSGYYTISVKLYQEIGSFYKQAGGATEVIRIVDGQITSAEIAIKSSASGSDSSGIDDIDNPGFPSPGAPVGSDAVSASTNQSDKKEETSPKLNPLTGAAYVKPPQVNNYGTVNLNYTIDVPPGRAGIQPGVGLSYTSSGGDGLLGIGWNLGTGLGVISRTTRHGQLYYDHRDTFTYSGKRLVKVEGPENSEAGVYRLEIESGFSRLELKDIENGGVWKVYDKAGTVTIFGENRSARIYRPDDENLTYTWNFSRSYDLNGNYMTAVYDTSEYEANHILYLTEIRYTGNYNNGTSAKQFVRFTYKERDEYYVSKAPGFIMKMEKLLDKIEIGWDAPGSGFFSGGETVLWDYEMIYEISEDSNRPLLVTVESSRNTTKPKFIYQPAYHHLVWRLINNHRFSFRFFW